MLCAPNVHSLGQRTLCQQLKQRRLSTEKLTWFASDGSQHLHIRHSRLKHKDQICHRRSSHSHQSSIRVVAARKRSIMIISDFFQVTIGAAGRELAPYTSLILGANV
jgi:hypothetical protein